MTPLQQAATALMDAMVQTDFTCRLGEQLDALEKALADEQAQAVEPVGEIVLFGEDLKEVSWANGKMPSVGSKLYTSPAPPATGERAELIELPVAFGEIQYQRPSGQWGRIEGYTRNQMREAVAAAVAKTEAKQAQQVAVPVPMSGYEISKWWASENGLEDCDMCIHGDFEKVVRAIEAHHKIGAKP